MTHGRRKLTLEGIIMSLPLAVGFAWYAFVIVSSTDANSAISATAKLAPGNIENMVLFLLLFIIVYSIFLVFEFRHLARKWKTIKK